MTDNEEKNEELYSYCYTTRDLYYDIIRIRDGSMEWLKQAIKRNEGEERDFAITDETIRREEDTIKHFNDYINACETPENKRTKEQVDILYYIENYVAKVFNTSGKDTDIDTAIDMAFVDWKLDKKRKEQ